MGPQANSQDRFHIIFGPKCQSIIQTFRAYIRIPNPHSIPKLTIQKPHIQNTTQKNKTHIQHITDMFQLMFCNGLPPCMARPPSTMGCNHLMSTPDLLQTTRANPDQTCKKQCHKRSHTHQEWTPHSVVNHTLGHIKSVLSRVACHSNLEG